MGKRRWIQGGFIAIEAKGCDAEVRLTRGPFNCHEACNNLTPNIERLFFSLSKLGWSVSDRLTAMEFEIFESIEN